MSDTGRLNDGTCVDVGIDDNMLLAGGDGGGYWLIKTNR
jgi:hypothetical protein